MKFSNKIWKHYTLSSLFLFTICVPAILLSHLLQTEVHPYPEHCCLLNHMFWNLLRQVKTDPPTREEVFLSGRWQNFDPVSLGAICSRWEKPSCHTGHLQLLPIEIMPLLQLLTMRSSGSVSLTMEWRKSNVAQWGRSFLRGSELCSCCLHNFRGTGFLNMCRSLMCYLRGSMVLLDFGFLDESFKKIYSWSQETGNS